MDLDLDPDYPEEVVELVEAGRYVDALQLVFQSEASRLVVQLFDAGLLRGDVLRECLYVAWTKSQTPALVVDPDDWCRMFRAAAPMNLVPDESLPAVAYRGASLSSEGVGMSWSTNAETARGFAQRTANVARTDAGIFVATVAESAVLARFS